MPKICDMAGVREYSEGEPVEFWFDEDRDRCIIIARTQGGYDCVNIDLFDLINWLRYGPKPEFANIAVDSISEVDGDGDHSQRD